MEAATAAAVVVVVVIIGAGMQGVGEWLGVGVQVDVSAAL